MPDFDNWQEIFDVINHNVKEVFAKIVDDLKELVRKELRDNWYWKHTPTAYERTYELINAITCERIHDQKGLQEYVIFYDESKIFPYDGTAEKPWTRHKSMFSGTVIDKDDKSHVLAHPEGDDFITGLTEIMEYGNPSSVYGFSESKAPKPFTTVEKFIREYLREIVSREMRKHGFVVTEEENLKYFEGK